MTAKVLKRSRAKFVSKQIVDQVGIFLQALPEKTPDTLSLRQTIERLRDPIEAALAKGYSYDELVPMLAQQGINIQPSTLKRYVLSGGDRAARKRSAGKTTRQSRKPRSKADDDAETLEDQLPISLSMPSDSEEETEAPAPRKRGRATAKATSEASDEQPKTNGRSRRATAASSASRAKSRSSSTRGSRKTTRG